MLQPVDNGMSLAVSSKPVARKGVRRNIRDKAKTLVRSSVKANVSLVEGVEDLINNFDRKTAEASGPETSSGVYNQKTSFSRKVGCQARASLGLAEGKRRFHIFYSIPFLCLRSSNFNPLKYFC